MAVVSTVVVPVDALCVIVVNFTTRIETGGSFMTLGH